MENNKIVNVTVRLSAEKNRQFNINTAALGLTKQTVLEKAVDTFNSMYADDSQYAKNAEKYLDKIEEPRK